MPELLVVSLNLRGIHDRWLKRAPLVVRALSELNPDVICLQEAATWCLQARWLAWRLRRATGRRYHVAQARKRGWRGVLEGLATLSVLPLSESASVALGAEGRVAQRARLSFDGLSTVIANAHLDHRSTGCEARAAQSRKLVEWLGTESPAVLCGDLNDRPESAALTVLLERFRSAHVEVGFELKGTAPAWEAGRVIDYILVGDGLEVVEAGVSLDTATNGVWPSDHVGLWAKLRLRPAAAE